MISLHPLDRGDIDRVAHIKLRDDQLVFAGTVTDAVNTPPTMDLHEIRKDDHAIGLFRIDRAYSESYNFAGPNDLGLRGVILDAREQGKGSGKAAMQALHGYVGAAYPQAQNLYLTVNFRNPAAYAVYGKAGFVDEGGVWPHGDAGPQHIMKLALQREAD